MKAVGRRPDRGPAHDGSSPPVPFGVLSLGGRPGAGGGRHRGRQDLPAPQTGEDRFRDGTRGFAKGDPDNGTPREERKTIERDLRTHGVSSRDAAAYAEGVRNGRSPVAVRCGGDDFGRVPDTLDTDGAIDIERIRVVWRSQSKTLSEADRPD